MKGLAVASLLGLLGSLAGCEKAPIDDTSALENPPPKPPNCPPLPELANVTLADGKVADVRIIQILDTKLYVPTDWLGSEYMIDKSFRGVGGFYSKADLDKFQPNIQSIECPGVLHTFNLRASLPTIGLRFFSNRGASLPLSNISSFSKLRSLSIQTSAKGIDGKDSVFPHSSGGASALVVASKELSFYFNMEDSLALDSTEWLAYRTSLLDLMAWLEMPPISRDKQKIFAIGESAALAVHHRHPGESRDLPSLSRLLGGGSRRSPG